MESESSVIYSQDTATFHYHEPHESSIYHSSFILRPILILSFDVRIFLQIGLFPSGFSTNIFLYTPHTSYT
jgi:hypothetical protein